jgi:hypothetical protein
MAKTTKHKNRLASKSISRIDSTPPPAVKDDRIFDHLKLIVVRLVEISAKLDIRGSEPPPESSVQTRVSLGTTDDASKLLADAVLTVASPSSDTGETLSSLKITLQLQCVYEVAGATSATIETSAERIAASSMLIMWPHFREILQSTTARMGLPPIVLPLFMGNPNDEQADSRPRLGSAKGKTKPAR